MNLRGWILAAALVVIADAWLLVGVARNRAGQPDAEIDLTERELHLVRLGEESSGVALRMEWESPRVFPFDAAPGWFGEGKLRELGFDVDKALRSGASTFFAALPKEAYVVFEYDGPAFEQWLAARPSQQDREAAARSHTRVVAVDAGREPEALRRRYPDRQRYLILRCVVRLVLPSKEPRRARGAVVLPMVQNVYVPLPFSRVFSGLSPTPRASGTPRYTVTLHSGRNHEPWVTGIRLLQQVQ